ncbi:hypothetical protein ABE042_04825 [Viridibacillus arvi]|uniref:hypothetical protein n=1 Tax=Viridibacillus arvi TaxID=263475 RepID=UPI003D27002E
MIKVNEFDVILTKDGTEATILDIFDKEPLYLAQRTDDDEIIGIKGDEVEKIIYKASQ